MQRVTNVMVQSLMLSDMHRNLSRLLDFQHKLATGKKHSRPSDHPIDVTRELALQTTLFENNQYIRNQDDAMTWLANTDAAFNQMMDVAHRIRELTIYAGNGALGPGETRAIADEIMELQEEMRNIANYSVEGRFLLSGLATGVRPFEKDPLGNIVYNGNTGKVQYEVERGVVGNVSFHGREVFPLEYVSNTLTSVEVPIDFMWKGRDEIVQIKVGDRAVKVHLTEDWVDRNINGRVDLTDYNRFRDHGEVRGLTLDDIAKQIEESMDMGDVSRLISVSVQKDYNNGTQRLVFKSHTGEPIQVTSWPETDRLQQTQSIVGEGLTAWTANDDGTLRIYVPGGLDETIDVVAGDTLQDIADKINSTVQGIEARLSPGDPLTEPVSLVVSSTKVDFQFHMDLTEGAREIFVSAPADPVVTLASEESKRPVDHSHIDFSTLMGMETTLKSRQFADGETFNVATDLHLRFESGKNVSELKIDGGGTLTIDQLAERIRQVAGDWLEVVVHEDHTEMGLGTSENLEEMTKRLILRPKDNEPLIVIDRNTSNHAMDLGLSTAIHSTGGQHVQVQFPDFLCLDRNMAARVQVTVGGKQFAVKLYPEDVAIDATAPTIVADQAKVMDQIVRQVNSAAGEELLAWTALDATATYPQVSIYAKNGEALRIIDLPIGDPAWTPSYTAGIAMQMGLASGITSTPVSEGTVLTAGTIRIESLGRTVDVDISAGDNPVTVADKIRKAAGSWLDVAYFDPDKPNATDDVMLNIAAKDGAPISIFDVTGNVARTVHIDNAIRGDTDVSGWAPDGALANNLLTITVDGYSHTIDLNAIFDSNDDGTTDIEDVVAAINARFQGQDVKAQLVEDGGNSYLVLTSPRGYRITVGGTAQPLLTGGETTTTPRAGSPSARYTQNVVVRTASDTRRTDFFDVMGNLANSVAAEDREGLSDIMLGQVDQFIDNLLKCRTSGGAILKRYENNQARFKQNNVYVTDLYSKVSDIDLAETSTQFAMAQAVYQSSLAVIAKIVQPTLVDFLR
ncbi:MAG: flagellar hook-associated protein FlgL [Synergistaceae bacterium]|nr:flagellar hook-associated protein FlgL [Synergistota bacterium]NLM71036.1 flagellar hook-associated protein FlgL [Synergistaceae bacterium]